MTDLNHGDACPFLKKTAAFHSVRQMSLIALPPLRFSTLVMVVTAVLKAVSLLGGGAYSGYRAPSAIV